MPMLEKGCCCLELRTCVRIMAWIQSICATLGLIAGVSIVCTVMAAGWEALVDPKSKGPDVLPADKAKAEELAKSIYAFLIIVGWIMVVNFLLGVSMGILLCMGAYKGNRGALKVYCIINLISLVITGLVILGLLFYYPNNALASQVLSFGLSTYFLICVYSYYQQLKEGSVYT